MVFEKRVNMCLVKKWEIDRNKLPNEWEKTNYGWQERP